MDIGNLDLRILQMRGNHLEIVLVEGKELDWVHGRGSLPCCCGVEA
jgi:hypothetical protein